ncbi:nitroreductase [Blastomonas sp. SL216]|uniref:nitroreductase n=1 Tax=Blastomonas sp. SL216 TaxID=2995169 RepID=UPI0023779665|nr:nitroreductase [Blastomonas sp. SL216]
MNVSEAVATRRSVRQFRPDPVPLDMIREILTKAQRSPSGGNTQPWNAIVLTGEPLADLTAKIKAKAATAPMGEGMEYPIYPEGLEGRYEQQRRAVGEAMFGALGIGREDGAGRVKQMMANWDSFGAPVQIFTYCRTYMGQPQWSDMGMWLQTVMLLLREAGLDSCPQEIWAMYGTYMRELLGIGDEFIFFTGMAVGYRDPDAPINGFPVPRVSIDDAIQFRGF